MRPSPAPLRSRTRGACTGTGPRPVRIARSGRCPWRTSRWRPSSVCLSAWPARKAATSGLDGLRQQGSRVRAQNFGERVGELCWLDQLDDVILDHRVSLLCWRSGGLEHPHDTPPYPLTPSPTSAHSSLGGPQPLGSASLAVNTDKQQLSTVRATLHLPYR